MLDGAEHLRGDVAALAGQLLSAAPGVRIVVTSRVVLGALSVREILQQRAVLLNAGAPGAAPSRGRRLVDVVRASYDLLQPEEQRLLAVLSVFAGPFTVAGPREVSGTGPAVAHQIRGLVDSSWRHYDRGHRPVPAGRREPGCTRRS